MSNPSPTSYDTKGQALLQGGQVDILHLLLIGEQVVGRTFVRRIIDDGGAILAQAVGEPEITAGGEQYVSFTFAGSVLTTLLGGGSAVDLRYVVQEILPGGVDYILGPLRYSVRATVVGGSPPSGPTADDPNFIPRISLRRADGTFSVQYASAQPSLPLDDLTLATAANQASEITLLTQLWSQVVGLVSAMGTGLTNDTAQIAKLELIRALLAGTLTVTGPLTDAQLGARGLALAAKQDVLAGLVATAAKQDTLAGLVATAAKQDILAGLVATSANQTAANATLASILSTLQAQSDLAATLWTDDSGAFYVRRDIIDQDGVTFTVAFTNPAGGAATPGAGLRPAANEQSLSQIQSLYDVLTTNGGGGYTAGDVVARTVILNQNVNPPIVEAAIWLNLTTGLAIAAPNPAHISQVNARSDALLQAITTAIQALPQNNVLGAGAAVIGKVGLQVAGADVSAGNPAAVADASNVAYTGAVAVSPGVTVTATRALMLNCTGAGNVDLVLQDGSTLTVPALVGLNIFPLAVTMVANTSTAAGVYSNLK